MVVTIAKEYNNLTAEQDVIIPLHLNYLDGLRALAALYVVIGHAGMQVLELDYIGNFLNMPFKRGSYAVDVFIVLSGFCLMLPVVRNKGAIKNGFWGFVKARAKRILPTYYLAVIFSLLLISTLINQKTGTLWDHSIPVSSYDVFMHIILMHDVFLETASKINYVFWSISVEWRIYFLFPFIIWIFRRLGAVKSTLLVIAFSFFIRVVLHPLHPEVLNLGIVGLHPHYLGLFTLGVLSAQLSFSNHFGFPFIKRIALSNYTLLCLLILTLVGEYLMLHWMVLDLLVGIDAAMLLVLLSTGKINYVCRVLSSKPLVFIGSFAYSLYLIHAPLLQVLSQYFVIPLNLSPTYSLLIMFFVGTPLIIGLSYIFFLIAERPFMHKKNVLKQNELTVVPS